MVVFISGVLVQPPSTPPAPAGPRQPRTGGGEEGAHGEGKRSFPRRGTARSAPEHRPQSSLLRQAVQAAHPPQRG